jgi:hypothetical protein
MERKEGTLSVWNWCLLSKRFRLDVYLNTWCMNLMTRSSPMLIKKHSLRKYDGIDEADVTSEGCGGGESWLVASVH